MRPFTRQILCFNTTICESWGCNDWSSSLTDSIFAMCSVDSWIAVTSLVPLSAQPKTTQESPTFAICKSPLHIIPTKQHDPADAIWGLPSHCLLTRERKLSSVAEKSLFDDIFRYALMFSCISCITRAESIWHLALLTKSLNETTGFLLELIKSSNY